MKKIISRLMVLSLLIIIIFPRFYHLGSQPPGLHIDEVSFAADAKAIAETGRDTWGVRFPLIFKAFGEWKAPGLVYSIAFWSKLTGSMNNTIARLPSAIAGIVSILMLYLTLRLLKPKANHSVVLLACFLYAFSPWIFDMSRVFYEAVSAMALFSIAIYFAVSGYLSKKIGKDFILFVVFASLAGYWYASIRYVAIIAIITAAILLRFKFKQIFSNSAKLLFILLIIGIGWIGDLFSSRGLTRLAYYQSKSDQGATLEIDEKRQYCYLSFDKNQDKTKLCYLYWNKPIERVINAAKTYSTYLGTDFLFVSAESEYGFDSQYGAFLLPLLPIFLVGLYEFISSSISLFESILRGTNPTVTSRIYTFLVILALTSLLPAAAAGNVNMRMGLIALYIISLVIGVGLITCYGWVNNFLPRIKYLVYLAYMGVVVFFISQSLVHYFLIFTHSNDLMWTSDSSDVFGYVKSISSQYDHIIDTELHGPLAPYFYGDITTKDIQNGNHSTPDDFGFTYLTAAGKYELNHTNIFDLACNKVSKNDQRKTLVITTPVNELTPVRSYAAYSWNKALLLHEVYDLDAVVNYELEHNQSFKSKCSPN